MHARVLHQPKITEYQNYFLSSLSCKIVLHQPKITEYQNVPILHQCVHVVLHQPKITEYQNVRQVSPMLVQFYINQKLQSIKTTDYEIEFNG